MENKENYSPAEVALYARRYSSLIKAANEFDRALNLKRKNVDKGFHANEFNFYNSAFKNVPPNVRAALLTEDRSTMDQIERLERIFEEYYKVK